MSLVAKWLCRFLSRKQIFGRAPTNREILYRNWYIQWHYGWKDVKSIFNMLIIWNVTNSTVSFIVERNHLLLHTVMYNTIPFVCLSLPDLSYISQMRTNAIIPTVDTNDNQAYGICNGDIDSVSFMVIPTARYDSASSNILMRNRMSCTVERLLCK